MDYSESTIIDMIINLGHIFILYSKGDFRFIDIYKIKMNDKREYEKNFLFTISYETIEGWPGIDKTSWYPDSIFSNEVMKNTLIIKNTNANN